MQEEQVRVQQKAPSEERNCNDSSGKTVLSAHFPSARLHQSRLPQRDRRSSGSKDGGKGKEISRRGHCDDRGRVTKSQKASQVSKEAQGGVGRPMMTMFPIVEFNPGAKDHQFARDLQRDLEGGHPEQTRPEPTCKGVNLPGLWALLQFLGLVWSRPLRKG